MGKLSEVEKLAKHLHIAGEWVEPWEEAAQPAFILMAEYVLSRFVERGFKNEAGANIEPAGMQSPTADEWLRVVTRRERAIESALLIAEDAENLGPEHSYRCGQQFRAIADALRTAKASVADRFAVDEVGEDRRSDDVKET
jgi:hypothetical protein